MEADLVRLKRIIDENNNKSSKFRKRLEKLTIEVVEDQVYIGAEG